MIDVRLVDSDGTPTPSSTPESSDAEDDDEEEDEGMTEVRYVPDDKTKLDDMFTVRKVTDQVPHSHKSRVLGISKCKILKI